LLLQVTGEEGKDSAGVDGLQVGGVVQNKITNNLVYNNKIAANSKDEIVFSYQCSWPHDPNSGDVEIV